MRILGVDPGLHGALFLAVSEGGLIREAACRVIDMPIIEARDVKSYVCGASLRDWLLNEAQPDQAFVERINAMPVLITRGKDGGAERRPMPASSAFQMGDANGSIRTALAVCGIAYHPVPSPRWKRFHGLRGSDKEAARRTAIRLLPGIASLFSRKKDQGRAEAALIAIYGTRYAMGGMSSGPNSRATGGDLFENV